MNATAARWLNKVPEVTLSFWVIKILSTTVGETGADYLAVDNAVRFTLHAGRIDPKAQTPPATPDSHCAPDHH